MGTVSRSVPVFVFHECGRSDGRQDKGKETQYDIVTMMLLLLLFLLLLLLLVFVIDLLVLSLLLLLLLDMQSCQQNDTMKKTRDTK